MPKTKRQTMDDDSDEDFVVVKVEDFSSDDDEEYSLDGARLPPAQRVKNNPSEKITNTTRKPAAQLDRDEAQFRKLMNEVERTHINRSFFNGQEPDSIIAYRNLVILKMWNKNVSTKAIAEFLDITPQTVVRVARQLNTTHKLTQPPPHPPVKITHGLAAHADSFFNTHQSFQFADFKHYLEPYLTQRHQTLSDSSMYNLLNMLGFSDKLPSKLAKVDSDWHKANRMKICTRLLELWDEYDFIFGLDECNINSINMKHRRWWSRKGQVAVSTGPDNIKVSVTCLLMVSRYGLERIHVQSDTLTAGVVGPAIDGWLSEMRHDSRFKRKKCMLLLDNARVHPKARLEDVADNQGIDIEYLPSYSPDLNPTEFFIKDLKHAMRAEFIKLVNDDVVRNKTSLEDWVATQGEAFMAKKAANKKEGSAIFHHCHDLMQMVVDCEGDIIQAKIQYKEQKKAGTLPHQLHPSNND